MPDDYGEAAAIRVLLADDHELLRHGLKLLLGLQEDIQVVGEAKTGQDAIEMAKTLKPDVILMDITMPGMDGLEACRRIRDQQLTTQVLILTMHESEEYFLQALHAGAAGYLVKNAAPGDLNMAIHSVAQGGAFLSPGLARALIRKLVAHSSDALQPLETAQASLPAQELSVLTPREIEVLTFVAEGYTNQQIANKLEISVKTVQAHRANVMEKLGLNNVTHLVRFAIRHKLITAEP